MAKFEVLYYPNYEPPIKWFRSFLLFFDKIYTLVPRDEHFHVSDDIARIQDIISGKDGEAIFEPRHPDNLDISLEEGKLQKIEAAFGILFEKDVKEGKIEYNNGKLTKKHNLKLTLSGNAAEIGGGYCFVHNNKISEEVRRILEKYNMIFPYNIFETKDNYTIVDTKAADIIISYIADNIARKEGGLHTITDNEMGFGVNSLNTFSATSTIDPRTIIATKLIVEIPKQVEHVSPQEYKEIRQRYTEIRQAFHSAILQLSHEYRLEEIKDEKILGEKVSEAIREFKTGVEKFRKSYFAHKIWEWTPIVVGGIAGLVGAAFQEPSIAITSTAVSAVIQVIQKQVPINEPKTDLEKAQKLIAGLGRDILKAQDMKRLILL